MPDVGESTTLRSSKSLTQDLRNSVLLKTKHRNAWHLPPGTTAAELFEQMKETKQAFVAPKLTANPERTPVGFLARPQAFALLRGQGQGLSRRRWTW